MNEPIRDEELDGLFGPTLGGFSGLVLAVSGGSDSTALLHLVARWLALPGGIGRRGIVATFDHGLRAQSAGEAAWVADRAAELGLQHRTLIWEGPKPRTGLQSAARKARYEALTTLAIEWCGTLTPTAIVTAHHVEDQAETVLMRLARGSGVDGLAGMAPVRWIVDGTLAVARPLLWLSKSRLVATLHAAGAAWCEDPSNENVAFERVRLRQAAAVLAELGVTAESIGHSARRVARARRALEMAVVAAERRVLELNEGAFATLSRRRFAHLAEELRVRILSRVLFAYGGQDVPPGLAQVEGLAAQLVRGRPGLRTTLGGCLVGLERSQIVVNREPGRGPLPVVAILPGGTVLWDRRFRIMLPPSAKTEVRITSLGPDSARELVARTPGLPMAAATTLPLGWRGDSSGLTVEFVYPRTEWT
jgi:tRNA(Ile)-lysidine synthase